MWAVLYFLYIFYPLLAEGISIKTNTTTLWQLNNIIEKEIPIKKKNIENIFGVEFKEERIEDFLFYTSMPDIILADSVIIKKANLLVRPSLVFDEKSAFSLELSGACISLADIRQHYGLMTITQFPRGRSLEEKTVHTANQSWGSLAFAFKEAKPSCLFSVTFRTNK